MKHYICDTSRPTRRWNEMLSEPMRAGFSRNEFRSTDGTDHVISEGLVVVHRSYFNENEFAALPSLLDANPSLVIVVVSADSTPSIPNECRHIRLYFRQTSVGIPLDGGFQQCLQRFSQHLEKDGVLNPNFSLLEPDSAYACAVRLLCEAWQWQMKTEQKEKPHDGVAIHAPINADDWFDPFLEGFRELNDAAKKLGAACDGVAKISEMMGNAKEEAKQFFAKLTDLYTPERYKSGSGKLTPNEFDEPINRLCEKLKRAGA